jgi:hypothetical protein
VTWEIMRGSFGKRQVVKQVDARDRASPSRSARDETIDDCQLL